MGRRGSCPLATLLLLAASTAAAASAASRLKSDDEAKLIALNLQVEHAIAPLTIEVPAPRFSWQPKHTQRAQHQSAFHVVVRRAALNPGSTVETVWDSGTVRSNRTHVLYAGRNPLVSDADYTWSVTWTDSNGAFSTPALGTFSTALLHGSVDWHGAEWLSSSGNGSLNMYRATLQLDKPPLRARLYIAGLGYYHSTINGVQTDEHLLGPQTTWEARALYDVWDVTALLRQGCNTLGVAMGHGWGSNTHLQAGGGRVKWDRQFIAVLSVTDTEGVTSYFPTVASSASAAQPRPMRFTAGAGPVTYDDIFDGEAYDGRIAAALQGWDTCNPEGVALHWENATKPHVSPADHGAELSVHTLQTRVIRDYSADTAGAITQPRPGVYVYNFSQNMAGVATLRVRGCVAGHIVRLRFGEILWSENGTVHNQFPVKIGGEIAPGQSGDKPGGMARMLANYTCSGAAEEVYRTQFSSYGFQFVQVEGYPSVPMDDAVTASMIGPNFEVAGRFTSSSAVLNKIQHSIVASVTANWANDVPTDCPHRERRGYLGDGQHAMETVLSNFASAPGYAKWLRDYRDQQLYDNLTLGQQYNALDPTKGFARGRIGGVAPYSGAQETDTAWGIAAWLVPEYVAEYYDDERIIAEAFSSAKWYAEHWIAVAESTGGWFSFDMYSDFGNTDTPGESYYLTKTQYFYIVALEHTARFAARLGETADAERFGKLASTARALFMQRLHHADGCYGNCTYVNQIFGLSLSDGGPDEADRASWAKALEHFGSNATNTQTAGRFGGGIVTLKLVYPLFQRFGEAALALRTLLHTDRSPSLGFMTTRDGTTLHEAWDMQNAYAGTWPGSFNHVMMGSPGRWFYTLFAGIDREAVPRGEWRSWSRLRLEPPRDPQLWEHLSSCSGALDTVVGQVSVSWHVQLPANRSSLLYTLDVEVPTNAHATVVVPTVLTAGQATIRENRGAVWAAGRFSAVAGIKAGTMGADGQSVLLSVGGGSYEFTVVKSGE